MTCVPKLSSKPRPSGGESGFTLVEVSIAMMLVLIGLASVFAMHGETLAVLRAARDSGSASQVLQQRVEQLRLNAYPNVVKSAVLVSLMNGIGGATDSEREMEGVTQFREEVTISTFARPGVSPAPLIRSFTVTRANGTATVSGSGNFETESQVKATLAVSWRDRRGSHRRDFATILSNGGVSAAGIGKNGSGSAPDALVGSGSTGTTTGSPPPSSGTCVHGRPWPHCGRQ
jgi:prepilin-type N-terminal cleavage/methylation domain-containing protein